MKSWQLQLGGWSFIFWLSSFQLMQLSNDRGYEELTSTIVGYTLGYITAFSGYIFWELIHGRWKSIFGDEKGLSRLLSAFAFLIIAAFSLIGFLNGIFNSMPWYYNTGFAVAGLVVAQGLIPIIRHFDGN